MEGVSVRSRNNDLSYISGARIVTIYLSQWNSCLVQLHLRGREWTNSALLFNDWDDAGPPPTITSRLGVTWDIYLGDLLWHREEVLSGLRFFIFWKRSVSPSSLGVFLWCFGCAFGWVCLFWFCFGLEDTWLFAFTSSPICGNSLSKTKRFDDRQSLERARHELKKKDLCWYNFLCVCVVVSYKPGKYTLKCKISLCSSDSLRIPSPPALDRKKMKKIWLCLSTFFACVGSWAVDFGFWHVWTVVWLVREPMAEGPWTRHKLLRGFFVWTVSCFLTIISMFLFVLIAISNCCQTYLMGVVIFMMQTISIIIAWSNHNMFWTFFRHYGYCHGFCSGITGAISKIQGPRLNFATSKGGFMNCKVGQWRSRVKKKLQQG